MTDTITWNNIQGTKNMDITANAVQKQTDGQDFYVMVLAEECFSIVLCHIFRRTAL